MFREVTGDVARVAVIHMSQDNPLRQLSTWAIAPTLLYQEDGLFTPEWHRSVAITGAWYPCADDDRFHIRIMFTAIAHKDTMAPVTAQEWSSFLDRMPHEPLALMTEFVGQPISEVNGGVSDPAGLFESLALDLANRGVSQLTDILVALAERDPGTLGVTTPVTFNR